MSRKSQVGKYKSVTIALDEEMAAQLDRAMIAFGLDSRQQVGTIAVGAWLAAVMEDATIHQMCQQAVDQVRKNEFQALADYYAKRAQEYGRIT